MQSTPLDPQTAPAPEPVSLGLLTAPDAVLRDRSGFVAEKLAVAGNARLLTDVKSEVRG